jgi:hypothetical protein
MSIPLPYNLCDRKRQEYYRRAHIMTSEKKAQANRRNALKSTGPKTQEGKSAVRLNALSHGLRSEEILLRGEDEEALRELGERLRNELQPAGELENLLVERIIASYWRLRRVGRVEAGIFAWKRSEELAERAEREAQGYESDEAEGIRRLLRITITDEKKHQEAHSRARRMRSEQEDETATLGRTFCAGRRPGQRVYEALQVRDCHRASALPGPAQARAPASRPARRCPHASLHMWTSRSRGCPKRGGAEIRGPHGCSSAWKSSHKYHPGEAGR